ncbi:hypothetical protein MMC32_006344 [Xylographa parallela]|nr:hypothetical protein [Xylographa parallela]
MAVGSECSPTSDICGRCRKLFLSEKAIGDEPRTDDSAVALQRRFETCQQERIKIALLAAMARSAAEMAILSRTMVAATAVSRRIFIVADIVLSIHALLHTLSSGRPNPQGTGRGWSADQRRPRDGPNLLAPSGNPPSDSLSLAALLEARHRPPDGSPAWVPERLAAAS